MGKEVVLALENPIMHGSASIYGLDVRLENVSLPAL